MPELFLRLRGDQVDYLVRGFTEAESADFSSSGTISADELARIQATWCVDESWTLNPDSVVVFIPTAQTISITCEVPGRNEQQRRRAVAFAVEEFVTQDIETLHIATAEIKKDEPVETLCVPRTQLDSWLEVLRKARIEPGLMTADAYGLPPAKDEAIIWFEGNLATVRSPLQIATIDIANLDLVLQSLRGEFDVDSGREVLVQINGSAPPSTLREAGFLVSEVRSEVVGPPLDYFVSQTSTAAPINLLQGDYRPIRHSTTSNQLVRSVLTWAAAAAIFFVSLTGIEGWWAARQADDARAEANALYEELFDARATGNPGARMRRALGRLPAGDDSGFLELLDALARSLKESVTTFSVRNLSFALGQRGLIADLAVPDYASLDALEAAVTSRGLGWTLSSAQQEGSQVRARVMVEAL